MGYSDNPPGAQKSCLPIEGWITALLIGIFMLGGGQENGQECFRTH